MNSSIERSRIVSDAVDVAQVVLFERQCRDRGWWDRMRGCFHADSTVKLTWFQGSGADFVAGSEAGGAKCRHRLSPPVVHVDGDRAVVELPAAIEFQVQVDDVEADLISYARMLYRVERRVDEWKILKIDAIYERDTLTPAIPGVSLRVDSTRFAKFRPPYRLLADHLIASGHVVSDDLYGDDRPEPVAALYDDAFTWLRG
jgi:hypothetical protein